MKTKVYSVFPACGKTWLYEHQDDYNLKILDSDSSYFAWIWACPEDDEQGMYSPNARKTNERNPSFPQNYIDHIKCKIESGKYDVLVVNYANGDMVGHTGNFDAAVKAVEALDVAVGEVAEAVIKAGGHMLITADHGNCEQMQDYESGQVHTQHTTEQVPLIYVGDKKVTVREGGKLSDVAPTLLDLMGLEIPKEMTGINLLEAK